MVLPENSPIIIDPTNNKKVHDIEALVHSNVSSSIIKTILIMKTEQMIVSGASCYVT